MALKTWKQTFKRDGEVYAGGDVSVYIAGTTTAARVFDPGGNLKDTAPQLQASNAGYVEFQIDDDDYPTGQLFDVVCSCGSCLDKEDIEYTSLMILSDTEGERYWPAEANATKGAKAGTNLYDSSDNTLDDADVITSQGTANNTTYINGSEQQSAVGNQIDIYDDFVVRSGGNIILYDGGDIQCYSGSPGTYIGSFYQLSILGFGGLGILSDNGYDIILSSDDDIYIGANDDISLSASGDLSLSATGSISVDQPINDSDGVSLQYNGSTKLGVGSAQISLSAHLVASSTSYDLGNGVDPWGEVHYCDAYDDCASCLIGDKNYDCLGILKGLRQCEELENYGHLTTGNLPRLDKRTLPDWLTSKDKLFMKIREGAGVLYPWEDFEKDWQDGEFLTWGTGRHESHFADVLAGAIIQLLDRIEKLEKLVA